MRESEGPRRGTNTPSENKKNEARNQARNKNTPSENTKTTTEQTTTQGRRERPTPSPPDVGASCEKTDRCTDSEIDYLEFASFVKQPNWNMHYNVAFRFSATYHWGGQSLH